MGRVARSLYLIDEDRLREVSMSPEVIAEATARQEREARWAAEREKRSRAAQKGWSRYTNSSKGNAAGGARQPKALKTAAACRD